MIQINCTNCKQLLTIDEAFAGGVCRCVHCGTIQTVPKHLKDQNGNGSGVVAQAVGAKSQKTLYQKKSVTVGDGGGGSAGSGTGLEDIASVVASSGLASSRLKKGAPGGRGAMEIPPARKMGLILGIAGGVVAILIAVIIFLATRDNKPADNGPTAGAGGSASTNPGAPFTGGISTPDTPKTSGGPLTFKKTPNFLGQSISEKTIVYIIDCGGAAKSEGKFDQMRAAVVKSLESLGTSRKFQVILWAAKDTPQPPPQFFPNNGPGTADTKNISDCAKWMENDVQTGTQTVVSPALDKAFKSKADVIMLVPVKSFLDDGFHPNIMKMRGKDKTKIHAFSLAQPELGEVLKKVAKDTGGAYHDVTREELRAAGQ